MMETMGKKIIVCVIVLVFLGLAMSPMINAQITENGVNDTSKNFFKLDGKPEPDLIIITPPEFELLLKRLEEHKDNQGVETRIVTLKEVYKVGFNGRDNPEKIKLFIKEAYDQWHIKYILLVGDHKKIPVRYVYNSDISFIYPEPCFISELYYADIYDKNGDFSSWDTNKNGIYGEWVGEEAEDKNIDLYPDVCVGRLACRNGIEVKTMVRKIIVYETKTYGEDWFKKIVVVSGDTYPNNVDPPIYEGEANALSVLENMSDFEHIKLFTSDNSFRGPWDVRTAINRGCGFMYFDGHADPTVWKTHPPEQNESITGLSLVTMTFLSNMRKMPIVVGGACHNAQFDVNFKKIFEDPIERNTWVPECWAWKLTRKMGGGAIATIANTGLGMTKEDKESNVGAGDFMDPQFFYEYGANKSTDILGELWKYSIINYLNNFSINWSTPAAWDYAYDAKTVQQWVLLGDPSLKIGGY